MILRPYYESKTATSPNCRHNQNNLTVRFHANILFGEYNTKKRPVDYLDWPLITEKPTDILNMYRQIMHAFGGFHYAL